MAPRNSTHHNLQGRSRSLELQHNTVLFIIIASLLPTIILLIIAYFQTITRARADLEGVINAATVKTDRLLADADTALRRSKLDLQNADTKTAVKILQRQIYNDFRFREAGIVNADGLLVASSLGVMDPSAPQSSTKARFDPSNLELQVLGLGRTQVMQEQSVVLMLKGSGQISSIYLLVDPMVLTSFLETLPDQDLGPEGFIAFMTSDKKLLSAIGTLPQGNFSGLQQPTFNTLQTTQTTKDEKIIIVGEISRNWVLRDWFQALTIGAPITILLSGLISYLFIRQVRQSNTLDYELKRGLVQNEFEIHYQPIIDLKTKRCVGSEALLRWRHPQRGLIYPGLFIPIAEQTGLIIPMTEWLLERVIQDQAALEQKFQNLYTSVNLSPAQLNTGDVDRLIQTLTGVRNQSQAKITFEITENKLIEEQAQTAQDVIARLKLLGIRFAIDDFGTGYSNIAYLQKLDLDQLKLDQLFVKGLEHGNQTAPIVDSLIDFGDRIGLTIVAEGIETETQYQYLRARGVRYGQGWLFSRPLPFEDFERFLQAQTQ
jgi:sensor c-di-GMP phosphodiesterase-like protein